MIDDLKLLWDEGVAAYDASKSEIFTLRAVLLWTINDFPAYGNVCGCTVKGYYACPVCAENTCSDRLKHCKKNVYMGHRKYLPMKHPFRSQKKAFNGKQEFLLHPMPLTGEQVLKKVEGIKIPYGKNLKVKIIQKMNPKKRKRKGIELKISKTSMSVHDNNDDVKTCWKKKSIFFELEYWKFLLVRHNLDVMHIEKNVYESIIGTLLNIPSKTKDGVNSRMDLVEMGLRTELAPQVQEKKTYLPPACYTLSRVEKKKF